MEAITNWTIENILIKKKIATTINRRSRELLTLSKVQTP